MKRFSRMLMAACVTARVAQAQDAKPDQPDPRAVQPERPTVATHAFTVSPGFLEIETGVERDRFAPGLTGFSVPTVFKIGIGTRAQLSINAPFPGPSVTNIGDVSVGVKYRFADDLPIVGAFSLLPSIKAPTGSDDRGLGTGTTDASLTAISSHKFGDLAMDINAGYTRRGGDGSVVPKNATLWTLSFGGPFTGPFGWVAECYGYPGTGGPSGQAPIVALLAGPTLLARGSLAFDAGVIIPVSGPQPHALYAGAVLNVGRIFPPF